MSSHTRPSHDGATLDSLPRFRRILAFSLLAATCLFLLCTFAVAVEHNSLGTTAELNHSIIFERLRQLAPHINVSLAMGEYTVLLNGGDVNSMSAALALLEQCEEPVIFQMGRDAILRPEQRDRLARITAIRHLDLKSSETLSRTDLIYLLEHTHASAVTFPKTANRDGALGDIPWSEHLRVVNLYDCPLKDECWMQLAATGNVENVNAARMTLSAAAWTAIKSMQRLTTLAVDGTSLGEDASSNIRGLSQLTSLTINGGVFTLTATEAIAQSLPNCTCLRFVNSDFNYGATKPLSALPKLNGLMLDACLIDPLDQVNLSELKQLKELSVAFTNVNATGIAALSVLRELERLNLTGCEAISESYRGLGLLKRLTMLQLGHSTITDRELNIIAELPSLHELDLQKTQVSDAGIIAIAGCSTLQKLDLRGTAITDRGIEALTVLNGLKALTLSDTIFSNGAAQLLGKMRSLEELNIAHCDLDDKCLKVILRLPHLAIIDISGNRRVTNASVK